MKKRFAAFILSLIVLVSAPAAEISATSISDILSREETEETPGSEEENEVQTGYTPEGMTRTQSNSINMLNYMTVLTQEINDSKGSRMFLESAYSSLINKYLSECCRYQDPGSADKYAGYAGELPDDQRKERQA